MRQGDEQEMQKKLSKYRVGNQQPKEKQRAMATLLFSQPGALPAASFDELIAAIRAVDMEDVRRQIAEAEATE
ncbi:MAG: hypothetical protein EBY23_05670 [Actinobacteria bacterium]|nr:hypothetical protein [Actinomycetota bacterium]